MGVDFGGLIEKRKITLKDLQGKSLIVDGYNALYQFLAIIRGKMGEPLTDRNGRVTSHLSGLFYRTVNMMERGIQLAYVFDGHPPAMKEIEIKRRMKIKEDALIQYDDAIKRGAFDEAKKFAQMTSKLKDDMVEDAKTLLNLLGIPWIQAPSEGEAQASHVVCKNDSWAVVSQDYDSFLFGAPRLVRNLTITGKRKLPGKNVYVELEPEIIELRKIIDDLKLTREQLIDLAILLGTDYNPGGFKGVGPKTALKLIREHGDLSKAIETIKESPNIDELFKIRELFLNPKVTDHYELKWRKPDLDAIVRFLVNDRDFSESRVRSAIDRFSRGWEKSEGATLENFFGS
ncbi:flap endonuclease-1 [[Eubacterium] cellulosolvens]